MLKDLVLNFITEQSLVFNLNFVKLQSLTKQR